MAKFIKLFVRTSNKYVVQTYMVRKEMIMTVWVVPEGRRETQGGAWVPVPSYLGVSTMSDKHIQLCPTKHPVADLSSLMGEIDEEYSDSNK